MPEGNGQAVQMEQPIPPTPSATVEERLAALEARMDKVVRITSQLLSQQVAPAIQQQIMEQISKELA